MPPATAPNETLLLLQALRYPLTRKVWWLSLAVLIAVLAGFTLLLSHRPPRSGRIAIVWFTVLASIIRLYISAVHTTITGYGDKPWEASALSSETLWETAKDTVVAAFLAFLPLIAWCVVAASQGFNAQPIASLFAFTGCHYFCMAVIGTSILGDWHGALPQHVIPAMWRAGRYFTLAGWGLLMLPTAFAAVMRYVGDNELIAWFVAPITLAFLLLTHAHLIGKLYLANQDRIGLE